MLSCSTNSSIGVCRLVKRGSSAGKRDWTTVVECTGAVRVRVRLARHDRFKQFGSTGLGILSEAEAVSHVQLPAGDEPARIVGKSTRMLGCALAFRIFRLMTRQCFSVYARPTATTSKWYLRGCAGGGVSSTDRRENSRSGRGPAVQQQVLIA